MSRTRKEKEAFKNVFSIDNFLERIINNNENMNYLMDNYFNDDTIEVAMNSLKNLKKTDKEYEFINFLHFVDKKLNFAGQARENRRHKIPTIFAGAIFIDKYNKEFKIYTDAQKMVIAKYSIIEDLDFYQNINNNFSRRIMDTIVNKNKDWAFQDDFMKIVLKYKNIKSEDEIINYINENDDADLIRECFYDFQNEIEKAGYNL